MDAQKPDNGARLSRNPRKNVFLTVNYLTLSTEFLNDVLEGGRIGASSLANAGLAILSSGEGDLDVSPMEQGNTQNSDASFVGSSGRDQKEFVITVVVIGVASIIVGYFTLQYTIVLSIFTTVFCIICLRY